MIGFFAIIFYFLTIFLKPLLQGKDMVEFYDYIQLQFYDLSVLGLR